MKYYGLSMSRDIKVIGYYPQTQVSEENELFSPFSDVRFTLGEFPDTIPEIWLKMNKKSIVTDFLYAINPYFGLIVNEKIKCLLSDFNIPKHKFYTANVKHKNNILEFYWFHFYDNLFQYADFDKTTIEIYHKFNFNVLDTIPLKSEDNLKQICSTLGFEKDVRLKELYFNNDFPNYDIMVENIIGYGNLISERLLNALKENNITGYEATPYTIIKE